MIYFKEDTTLIGVSELRTNIDKIIEQSKRSKVLIERRNKPIAVIIAKEKYDQIEKTLELLEDFALGYLAKERDSNSKKRDYVDIEEALKKLG